MKPREQILLFGMVVSLILVAVNAVDNFRLRSLWKQSNVEQQTNPPQEWTRLSRDHWMSSNKLVATVPWVNDTNDLTIVDWGYNNICIGIAAGLTVTTQHNVIAIGDYAVASNSFEMVIKFKSGKEWRMQLPTNDPVALSRHIVPPVTK